MHSFLISKRMRHFSRYGAPALGALLFASAGAAQTPVTFLQSPNIGDCSSLATGDFNGDGNLDVACAGASVTIWFGDGKGHFRESAQQLPFFYAEVVAGDFNGDGHMDLVVATSNYYETSNQVAFLPGNGNGAFGPVVTVSALQAASLATIRATPEGPLSLVISISTYPSNGPFTVEVFPGNGNGTFQAPISTGILSSTNIAVADFNGDGIPDIASIGEPNQSSQSSLIQVVLGIGDGSFGAPVTTPVAESDPFAAADFTNDGTPDIAWSDGTNIVVYRGNGDGTFSPGPTTASLTEEVLLAVDVNGDGLPDLVLADMAVALNTGDGAFGGLQWYQSQFENAAVAGDFRNLNLNDLIVAGDYYENEGAGRFRGAPEFPASCEACFAGVAGDFNHDGKLDFATFGAGNIRVFEGSGEGSFSGVRETPIVLPQYSHVFAMAAADFTGDGKRDLAIGTFKGTSGEVLILPGNGDGTFGSQTVAYTGEGVNSIVAADFNGDGQIDFVIATDSGIVVRCANGAGGFTTTAQIPGNSNYEDVIIADFNRDGIPDLASQSAVYLGNGDGTFRRSYTFPESWTQILTGDFNGDGVPDVVTFDGYGGSNLGSMVEWPGLGDGTFGLPLTVSTADISIGAVADLNHDGISDIIAGDDENSYLDEQILYLGKGDGTFTTEVVSNLPTASTVSVPGLFSNSRYPDLLFFNQTGQLLVLTNSTK